MGDEPSNEELLAQQKANCIFCKIIKGEIPSKKVFEDEKIVAILDINPATKGHTLVMTKEHYPIMPLIPPEEFEHLFGSTAGLSRMVREGALAQRCTTFIANGAVAGQQSPHFLFHLIPREDGDGLNDLTIPKKGVNQSDIAELMKTNLYSVMRQHLMKSGKLGLLQVGQAVTEETAAKENEKREGKEERREEGVRTAAPAEKAAPTPAQGARQEQLAQIIEQNQELKALLINNPAKLQEIIEQNPQFKDIFAGVDIEKLGKALRQQHFESLAQRSGEEERRPGAEESGEREESAEEATPIMREEEKEEKKEDDLRPAAEMTMHQIFAFIDSKPKLRAYILEDPEGLKRLIPTNERLKTFFRGSNVNAIIQAYQEYAKEAQDVRVTVEPEEEKTTEAHQPKGPSREESGDAWDEVRSGSSLDRIGRLFR